MNLLWLIFPLSTQSFRHHMSFNRGLRSTTWKPLYATNENNNKESSSSKTALLEVTKLLENKVSTKKSADDLVFVKNTQKIHAIDIKKVQSQVYRIQKILKVDNFAVDVWFCSNGKMRELNKGWRDKTKSTDILSFPVNDFVSPEVFEDKSIFSNKQSVSSNDESDEGGQIDKHLGDIVVCPSYVYRRLLEDKRYYENLSSRGTTTAATSSPKNEDDDIINVVEEEDEEEEDAGVSRAMATEFNLDERIGLLLIHGVLHLVGYDHETPEEWRVMTDREEQVIEIFKKLKSGTSD